MHRRSSQLKRLLWLFLLSLSLCWALFHGFSLPSYSQTTPLSPREALEAEIKEDVIRHLAIRDEPLDHSSIRDLYFEEAESAGLTYEELIDLYETEYASQKAAQAPGFWEAFRPNNDWILWLISIPALLYVNRLKEWLGAKIKAFNDWIYNQLSGTRLFRRIALRKYRAALADNCKHLPMPFLRDRAPLNMEDVYVPLKMSETREEASASSDSTVPQSHELLDAYKAIAEHRRLMVIGEPGSGKSVLLKHMAWSYGEGKLDWLSDRPVVVLLELYRLSEAKLDEAKLIQALVKAFDRNQFPSAGQFVQQMLKKGTLMLLLDGLDEVSSDIRQSVVQTLRDFLKKYTKCRVVITCRTAIYNGEFIAIADRKLEVVEFTDQQIQQFLRAWEADLKRARKSVSQLMAALRERPLILKLARNPLLMTLVTYLYAEPGFVLPRSRADFYQESTRILLEQREYKGDDDYKFNRYDANEKRRVLEHLALYTQEHQNELSDRRSLAASVVREQIRQVLPDLDIAEDEASSILDEIAERSGLLREIDGGDRFLFPHLTMQEFFAATALKEDEDFLIERFRTDPAAWREVVKLWCSLANDSTILVQAVHERDTLTSFECLAEARKIDQILADEIINRFEPLLDQPQTDETVMRAFGAVAANERGRGKAVFTLLERTLFDPQASSLRRYNAADSLSRTNLIKAAEVLLRWYEDNAAIIRMGDVAVPGLSKMAKQGNTKAVDDLFEIGTPMAAIELAQFLWAPNLKTNEDDHYPPGADLVVYRSAWYLAGMLSQTEIEESLRDAFKDDSSDTWKKYGSLDWIWQPFDKEQSFLSIIAGRIAYLLEAITAESIPQSYKALDPRLVVPLCALHLRPQNIPKELSKSDEALLEAEPTHDVLARCNIAVARIYEKYFPQDKKWQRVLSGIDPFLQLDIINRLTKEPAPQKKDWLNLKNLVKYELRNGWHYNTVLAISIILSSIAIIYMGAECTIRPSISNSALFIVIVPITLIFWSTFWISNNRAPAIFMKLGFIGPITFFREYGQLLIKGFIWSGVEPLFLALARSRQRKLAFTGSGIIAATMFALASFMVLDSGNYFRAFGIFAILASLACTPFVTQTTSTYSRTNDNDDDIITGDDGLSYGPVSGAFVITLVVWIIVYNVHARITADLTILGAGIGIVLMSVAFNGVQSWHQLELEPDSSSLKKILLKIKAFLSFPWFCWFPLTIFSDVAALHELLKGTSTLTYPIWGQTTVVSLIFAGLYGALWRWGLYLDTRARNPFQQGYIGKVLLKRR